MLIIQSLCAKVNSPRKADVCQQESERTDRTASTSESMAQRQWLAKQHLEAEYAFTRWRVRYNMVLYIAKQYASEQVNRRAERRQTLGASLMRIIASFFEDLILRTCMQ